MSSERKFLVFGCSHSKWQYKPTWTDMLEVCGFDLINLAAAGHGNEYILAKLIEYMRHYPDDDSEIIIQLSYPTRIFENWDRLNLSNQKKYMNLFSIMKICDEFDVTDQFINEKYKDIQYCLYSILKINNKTFHIMCVDDNLIAELEPYKIDCHIEYNYNSNDKIRTHDYTNHNKGGVIDNHMDMDQQYDVVKKLVLKLGLKIPVEKCESYVTEMKYYYRSEIRDASDRGVNKKLIINQIQDIKNKYIQME